MERINKHILRLEEFHSEFLTRIYIEFSVKVSEVCEKYNLKYMNNGTGAWDIYDDEVSFNEVLFNLKYLDIGYSIVDAYYNVNKRTARSEELYRPFYDVIYPLYLKEIEISKYLNYAKIMRNLDIINIVKKDKK